MPTALHSITPMVPSGSIGLAASLDFYTRHMGFAVEWRTDAMAGIRRGDVAMHLVENRTEAWAENASFSIGVADLDALYAEYRGIPAEVGQLEVKSWGRREFHMIVPGRVCLQFFQADEGADDAVRACERQLRQAQLDGDVDALDRLVDDALHFTGPDGAPYGKADDLDAHRRGWVRITRLEPSEELIRRIGRVAVVSVRMEMAGSFKGEPFAGPFRYTRVWAERDGAWRVVAGHVSGITEAAAGR